MQCLTEATLSDLAFDEVHGVTRVTRDAERHMDDCPKCAARLEEYIKIARGLERAAKSQSATQSRDYCLDENELSEYIDDVLPEHERDRLEAHLAKCQLCVGAVLEAKACIEDLMPSKMAYVIQRVGEGLELLAKPARGFSLLHHEPATVLKPGVETQKIYSWSQEVDDGLVLFDLQRHRDGQVSVHMTLKFYTTPDDPTRIVVRQRGNIIQAETVPDSGEIFLDDLGAEDYEIEFVSSEQKIGPFALTIE